MHDCEILLQPFELRRLKAIQTAFRVGWSELSKDGDMSDPFVRNKLAGTLAALAQSGIDDADELKWRALHRLRCRKNASSSAGGEPWHANASTESGAHQSQPQGCQLLRAP
jgi:hypothetical protein